MPQKCTFAFELCVGDLVTLKAMHKLNPATCRAFSVISLCGVHSGPTHETFYLLRAIHPGSMWHRGGVQDVSLPQAVLGGHIAPEGELMLFPEESRAAYDETTKNK